MIFSDSTIVDRITSPRNANDTNNSGISTRRLSKPIICLVANGSAAVAASMPKPGSTFSILSQSRRVSRFSQLGNVARGSARPSCTA